MQLQKHTLALEDLAWALHLLAPEGAGPATLDALSLAAEALRRTAEAQAEQAEEETA